MPCPARARPSASGDLYDSGPGAGPPAQRPGDQPTVDMKQERCPQSAGKRKTPRPSREGGASWTVPFSRLYCTRSIGLLLAFSFELKVVWLSELDTSALMAKETSVAPAVFWACRYEVTSHS